MHAGPAPSTGPARKRGGSVGDGLARTSWGIRGHVSTAAALNEPALPELQLASRLSEVTVYRQGALVRRVAELPAQAAPGTLLRIGPLPLGAQDASLRVGLEGEGDLMATDLHIALVAPAPPSAGPPPRQEAIQAAQLRVRQLDEDLERVDEECRVLRDLSLPEVQAADRGAPSQLTPARLALSQLRHQELEALTQRRTQLQEQLRQARRDLDALLDEQHRSSSDEPPQKHELRKEVRVQLGGTASGQPATLWVEYLVMEARWAPVYALHLNTAMQQARWEARASVCQATGEDWNAVRLRVSTAEALAWAELPQLHSLRIGKRQAVAPQAGWRPPPANTEALFANYDDARRRLKAPIDARGLQQLSRALSRPPLEATPPPEQKTGAPPPQPSRPEGPALADEPSFVLASMPAMAPPPPPAPPPGFAPPPPSAPAVRRASAAGGMPKRRTRAEPAPALEAAPVGEVEPPSTTWEPGDLLHYHTLRMPNADATQRGKLVPVPPEQQHPPPPGWSESAVAAALHRPGASVARLSLPQGQRAPGGVTAYDYAFEAEAPVDVPSDLSFHQVHLQSAEGPCQLRYVTVPRETQDVFRFAELPNPFAGPILPAPVDVYVGEDFWLTATTGFQPPSGAVELGLGVEQGVKVARNTHFHEASGGLLAGARQLHHRVEIELNNRTPRPAPVEVRERVPVVPEGEEDVRVVQVKTQPSWEELRQTTPARGAHCWRVTVPPGQKQTLTLSYTVELPSKLELVGGNRRD